MTIGNTLDFTTYGSGILCGNGTVQSDVTIGQYSTIAPGGNPCLPESCAPGLLTIDGDYTQTEEGYLFLELGGTMRGEEYDVLNITGNATLGGMLDIAFLEGFTPTLGDTFDILDWATTFTTGSQFDSLMLPELVDDDWYWNTSRLYTTGTLSVATTVPEPTTPSQCY